jgi:cytochrome P450
LLLPPIHGARLQAWTQTIIDATDDEIDAWPVGREFALMPSMQALTLRVIVQAVFGYDPGPDSDELTRRLRAMIEPLAQPRAMMLAALLSRFGRGAGPQAQFAARRRAVDELLLEEIRRRRRDPALDRRDDVFSALLTARDEDGHGLSDAEVRDELLTLLLAGHETTATALAWTFDLLLHNPAVHARALGGDDRYLDAVAKESLRLRPVIPGVGRVVAGEPFALNGWRIAPGVEINPSIRMIHWRDDLYPGAEEFRPDRFLGDGAPDTYTWLPFGGGTRRCLGASFAQLEMRLVLARVLARTRLRAASDEPDRMQFRAITIAPRDGARVVLERRS